MSSSTTLVLYVNWKNGQSVARQVSKFIWGSVQLKKTGRGDKNQHSKGMVVPPYIQGTSNKLQRVNRKHNIATTFQAPQLRKSFVHPKDKREPSETAGRVYEINYQNCDFSYASETGRLLSTRIKEHWKSNKSQTKSILDQQGLHQYQINTNQLFQIMLQRVR